MIASRLRASGPVTLLVAIVLGVAAGSCGATNPPSPSRAAASATTTAATAGAASVAASLTPVPGGASPSASAFAETPSRLPATTTVQGFGEIFDALPPSFPRLPDQTETDIGGATSGQFVSNMTAAAATALLSSRLSAAGWSVDAGSPLEDGSVVVEATRPGSGCKAQITFTPASGSIMMSVLYGATCPFE